MHDNRNSIQEYPEISTGNKSGSLVGGDIIWLAAHNVIKPATELTHYEIKSHHQGDKQYTMDLQK